MKGTPEQSRREGGRESEKACSRHTTVGPWGVPSGLVVMNQQNGIVRESVWDMPPTLRTYRSQIMILSVQ